MREIRTSGLMSGIGNGALKLPRQISTLTELVEGRSVYAGFDLEQA